MIHVEFADLSGFGIRFPNDRVRMVLAQPHLPRKDFTTDEPFRFLPEASQRQEHILQRTLTVATERHRGESATHFTLIPEYGIPGLRGVEVIERVLRSKQWPRATVLIGGTDGLDRDEYAQLIAGENTNVVAEHNGAERVDDDQWVNCAITWVKSADGTLNRWIQPKLHPAWEEQDTLHQRMFKGRSVYMFRGQRENGTPFLFGTLVCFDWIAQATDDTRVLDCLLEQVHQEAGALQLPISWIFIIQRNRRPSHYSFLRNVEEFYRQNVFPNADRTDACLVFANAAGRSTPGPAECFGAASLIFSPRSPFSESQACPPTFSHGGPRFRDGSDALRACNCKDIIFRERGACIHSFEQINPRSVVLGTDGRALAVENASVFPVSGEPEPRAPRRPVPAATKWMNDALDQVEAVSRDYNVDLGDALEERHDQTICELRALESADATNLLRLGVVAKERPPDEWGTTQEHGLQHIVNTLDILALGVPLESIGVEPTHAITEVGGRGLDVVAVLGPTHLDCWEHLRLLGVRNRLGHILLVSRDKDNRPWSPRFRRIVEPTRTRIAAERRFTEPAGASFQIGYGDLLRILETANRATEIAEQINAELNNA